MRHENRICLILMISVLLGSFGSRADHHTELTLTHEPNSLYISTFNVYKLGAVAEKYDSEHEEVDTAIQEAIPDRILNLANVLAVGKFHLVALQELNTGIRGKRAMEDLVRALHEEHSLDYEYFVSGHIGRGLIPEAIGFLYQEDVLRPQPLPGTTNLTSNIEIDGRDMVRTKWVAGDFDFTLISAHLAWGNKSDRDDGYEEIQQILTSDTPSRYSDDPDIIVLGDFNRFGKPHESFKILDYDPQKYYAPNITFFDPDFESEDNVLKRHITNKGVPDHNPQFLSTTVSQNTFVYDIIFFTHDADEEFAGNGATAMYGKDFGIIHFDEEGGFGYQDEGNGFTGKTKDLEHNDLKELYSDHRPLYIRFKLGTGNFDGNGGATPSVDSFFGTPGGRKYHLPTCRYVKERTDLVSFETRASAEGESLEACKVCKP